MWPSVTTVIVTRVMITFTNLYHDSELLVVPMSIPLPQVDYTAVANWPMRWALWCQTIPSPQYKPGVSNHWTGIWTGMVEWTMESLYTADSTISHCVLASLSLSTLSDLRRVSFIASNATRMHLLKLIRYVHNPNTLRRMPKCKSWSWIR